MLSPATPQTAGTTWQACPPGSVSSDGKTLASFHPYSCVGFHKGCGTTMTLYDMLPWMVGKRLGGCWARPRPRTFTVATTLCVRFCDQATPSKGIAHASDTTWKFCGGQFCSLIAPCHHVPQTLDDKTVASFMASQGHKGLSRNWHEFSLAQVCVRARLV